MNKIIIYIILILSSLLISYNISYSNNLYQGIRIHSNEIKNIKINSSKNKIINVLGYPSILDSLNNKFIYLYYCNINNKINKYLILILKFKNNILIEIKMYKKI